MATHEMSVDTIFCTRRNAVTLSAVIRCHERPVPSYEPLHIDRHRATLFGA